MVDERDVEGYLRRAVEALGGECDKFDAGSKAGMPDRVVILPGGVLVWVETKKPKGGKLSEIQKLRHRRLRALGQRVEVLSTKDAVRQFLSEYKKEPETY